MLGMESSIMPTIAICHNSIILAPQRSILNTHRQFYGSLIKKCLLIDYQSYLVFQVSIFSLVVSNFVSLTCLNMGNIIDTLTYWSISFYFPRRGKITFQVSYARVSDLADSCFVIFSFVMSASSSWSQSWQSVWLFFERYKYLNRNCQHGVN